MYPHKNHAPFPPARRAKSSSVFSNCSGRTFFRLSQCKYILFLGSLQEKSADFSYKLRQRRKIARLASVPGGQIYCSTCRPEPPGQVHAVVIFLFQVHVQQRQVSCGQCSCSDHVCIRVFYLQMLTFSPSASMVSRTLEWILSSILASSSQSNIRSIKPFSLQRHEIC